MQNVISYTDFNQKIAGHDRVVLLLYNPANEPSQCAFRSLTAAASLIRNTAIFSADVSQVRDIHPVYRITSSPSLLLFKVGELVNVVKGCHDRTTLLALLSDELSPVRSGNEAKPAKRVTVYSTPTCSWCNTLKSWLRKNNIQYNDIDVSRDEKAAQDLVRRTGQQGVPQTEINGQVVVGFNQQRLKELLEIQ